jgi:hypothetical protein
MALVEAQRRALERREDVPPKGLVKRGAGQFVLQLILGQRRLLEPPRPRGGRQLPDVEVGLAGLGIGPAAVPVVELGLAEAGEAVDGSGRAIADVANGQDALGADLDLRQGRLAPSAEDDALVNRRKSSGKR